MSATTFLPFHDGELEAQRLAGAAARVAAIRDHMPEQHRSFFALLRYAFLGMLDRDGWPIATMLAGSTGFISTPNDRTLRIAATIDHHDPAAPHFNIGGAIGLLGLDLETRRRNRANGVIAARDDGGLVMSVRESFGNCPQYIQAREVASAPVVDRPASAFTTLDEAHRAFIRSADTLFIATNSGPVRGAAGGADVSHRGGRPGFVRVDGDTLTIPDFAGNRYFNTLGNLVLAPRAALLFLDFERGDLLQLQGEATVDWTVDANQAIAGAERLVRFRVRRGWLRAGAAPLRWTFRGYAPTTERTGSWPSSDAA